MINIYNIFVRMSIFKLLLPAFAISAMHVQAQVPPVHPSSEIYQQIRKLGVLGSVLYIAAHPDDENTRLLAWLSNDRLLKTGYLSITRGDGGQNLIGDEQGIELGLIRTQELLAARRIDGAEQFFTRAFDFGYSKSTDEALRIWNEDKILSDVVWVIRKFRPDVIITRFPPDSRAGHGHHSASSVLAEKAFTKAADPGAYPSQLSYGVKPWQAMRIMWNGYNFGGINTTSEDQMKIDVGGFNPLIGKSYGEIFAASRSQHKSQGFGTAATRGSQMEYFSFTGGKKPAHDLTDGIDLTWNRVGAGRIGTMIEDILKAYRLSNPSLSVPALVRLYEEIRKLPDSYWRSVKMEETQEVIAEAGGLWMEAYASVPSVEQGSSLTVHFSVNNREGASMKLESIGVDHTDTAVNMVAAANRNLNFSLNTAVPLSYPVSQPYWLKEKMTTGSYNVQDQQLIGRPDPEPAFLARFDVSIGGQLFRYARPVAYRHTDPVKGEIHQPLIVTPAPSHAAGYGVLEHISYAHIPDIYYFNNDTSGISIHDLKIAGKKIGYIEGAGDKVPAALVRMGYDVTMLTEHDLTMPFLSRFDAIITGVRAYNVHSFLAGKNPQLNEYISNGGNFIVQYNTNSNVGPGEDLIGPYPFHISRDRVTDENSPVKFLLPGHPVFNYPNKITLKDFEGWVQERGIYFADRLSPAFSTPLALKDPGEEEQNGSLIIADYGKGKFVYTGLVFFRELPAGVNGAYRLLANIIALNKSNQHP